MPIRSRRSGTTVDRLFFVEKILEPPKPSWRPRPQPPLSPSFAIPVSSRPLILSGHSYRQSNVINVPSNAMGAPASNPASITPAALDFSNTPNTEELPCFPKQMKLATKLLGRVEDGAGGQIRWNDIVKASSTDHISNSKSTDSNLSAHETYWRQVSRLCSF